MGKNALNIWADVPVLLAVARAGTLSAAAEDLKCDRTTVSRRLEALERSLRHKLFERENGILKLSTAGWKAFAHAEKAEQELISGGIFSNHQAHPGGRLRVSMSEQILFALPSIFKSFAHDNPEILMEISTTDRAVDLRHFEADVVLRICRGAIQNAETMVLGTPTYSLYRATSIDPSELGYIARPQEKSVPKALRRYFGKCEIVSAIDGVVTMLAMIVTGTGMGVLPDFLAFQDRRLTKVHGPLPDLGFHLAIGFLPEHRRLRRIKLFTEHLSASFRNVQGFKQPD